MEISTGGKFKKVFLDMRLMHHEKVIWKDGQNIEWDIWDCSQCDWIHKIEIENKIAIDPIM
jgi:Zn-finger protein|tara:strand:- start:687 stop:869 length:183 start_codon:yes stop_codon:yes gene_type:complete